MGQRYIYIYIYDDGDDDDGDDNNDDDTNGDDAILLFCGIHGR